MAASGAAAASEVAAEVKALLDLSNDSLEKICRALLDPLKPCDAVALAGTFVLTICARTVMTL